MSGHVSIGTFFGVKNGDGENVRLDKNVVVGGMCYAEVTWLVRNCFACA